MSMLDSFFYKSFKGPKCKTLLKLTIPRIKLLRNRREIQIKQMRRDIAKLLETGQEATARIRVEHIVREENMMAAQEIVELFCELISVRVPIIETQRECPLDLKEAISSVCFAAPRCADLPELMHVQMLFVSKYGKEFVAAATELRPDCGVNRQLIELLSVCAPAPEKKLKLLTDIAEEHGLDWDPTSTETEIFKRPEDLLNGPSQFSTASVLPLPREKHEETLKQLSSNVSDEQGADFDSDGLDFPEVPKVSVRPNASQSIVTPPVPPVSTTNDESSEEEADESPQHHSDLKQEETSQWDQHRSNLKQEEINQWDQHQPNLKQEEINQWGTVNKTYKLLDEVRPPPVLSASSYSAAAKPASTLKHGIDHNVDLQDVLAAAQAAADSAERAASAARSAASLAQLRITELVKKNNDQVSAGSPTFYSQDEVDHEKMPVEKDNINHQRSFDGSPLSGSHLTDKHLWDSDSLQRNTSDLKFDSYTSFGTSSQPELCHEQPHRTASMDDDPNFSYPNLFTSKRDNDDEDGKSGFV